MTVENTKGQPIKVLLLEDNSDDMVMVKEALHAPGSVTLEVAWEQSLKAGLQKLDEGVCDVLLLDLGLPEKQGLSTLNEVLNKRLDIPIVVLTGLDDEHVGVEAIKQGAQDYLVKNQVMPETIRRVIYYAIERKKILSMRNQFVNMLNHDLKNPLATLRIVMETFYAAQKGEMTHEQSASMKIGRKVLDRMEAMISRLLNLAKMESGKQVLNRVDFKFCELVKEICIGFDVIAKEKGINLLQDFPNEDVLINADKGSVSQVLANLLANAYKFTNEGRVQIQVTAENNELKCSIKDSGCGIDREHLPFVFDKYRQFARPKSTDKGFGLGLSICKEIIEAHQGRIEAESVLGEGSTFTFYIPLS